MNVYCQLQTLHSQITLTLPNVLVCQALTPKLLSKIYNTANTVICIGAIKNVRLTKGDEQCQQTIFSSLHLRYSN